MKWNRIKLVIIALLILANLYLVIQLIQLNNINSEIPDNSINSICELLKDNGISIESNIVPRNIRIRDGHKIVDSFEHYTNIANSVFALPNGIITDVSNSTNYYKYIFSNGSSITFSSDSTFVFKSDDAADSDIDAIISNQAYQSIGSYDLKIIDQFDDYFNFNGYVNTDVNTTAQHVCSFDVVFLHYYPYENCFLYCLTQKIDNVRLEDNRIYCLVSDDKIKEISGMSIFLPQLERLSIPNKDIINVLFSFNNYVSSMRQLDGNAFKNTKISSIEDSFSIFSYNETNYLLPSVTIVTEDNHRFVVNLYDLRIVSYNNN